MTWSAYFQYVGIDVSQAYNELWLDRSTMAIEAAVQGLGVVLESDILTEDEVRDGRLVAPFDAQSASLSTTSYFLVTPRGAARGVLARLHGLAAKRHPAAEPTMTPTPEPRRTGAS